MIKCRDFPAVDGKFLEIFSVFLVLQWMLCEHTTSGYYLDGTIEGQQLSSVWLELDPPNAHSGRLYQTYVASTNLTDYGIRFLVSKVGSQELPSWLWYDNISYSLTGIPLASDVGVHQLFVLAMRFNETASSSDLLGAQTVEINVVSTANYSYCSKGTSFVGTEVSLAVNGTQLNSTQRIELYQGIVTEFNLSDRANSVYFKSELTPKKGNLSSCNVVEKYEANTSYSGPVLTVSWLAGCHLSFTNISENISEKLGESIFDYSVYSWRVLSGNDSILCFMDIHEGTSLSTFYPSSLGQATSPSAQMDHTRTTQSPMSVFWWNTTLISVGISPTHTRRSDQQVPETTFGPPAASSLSILHSTQRIALDNTTLVSSGIAPTHTPRRGQQVRNTTTPNFAVIASSLTAVHSTHQSNNISFVYLDTSVPLNSTNLYPSLSNVFNRTLTLTSLLEGKSDIINIRATIVSDARTNSLHADLVISSTKSDAFPTISQSITPVQNYDPIVRRPLPPLNITICQYLYYEIPQDTFWDREDGNGLALQLRELPTDSWLKLDPIGNVIYGLPVSSQIFDKNSTTVDLEYILSATDSNGRAVNTSLQLKIHDHLRPTGQIISIVAEVQSTMFNPLQLVQGISEYLYSGDNATMKILRLNVTLPNVFLEWSDCKVVTDVCDVKQVERTQRLVRINDNFINPHFVIALVPEFILVSARVEKIGLCLNEPPVARTYRLYLNVTCCGKFRYEIPRDLFLDQEDGDIRNLSLSILFPSASRAQSERWIMLNDTSKNLEGVTILEEIKAQPDFPEFFIVAQDSGRLETNVSVTITIQHPLPVSNYFVSLFTKSRQAFSTPLQEVFAIIEKLSSYFDSKSSDEIRVLSYSRENAVTVFTWSMADLRLKPCDTAAIANISTRLKEADGRVDAGFKSMMEPEFVVQFIFDERLGHCRDGANEQPTVAIPLHQLRSNLTYFEYKIPASTFNDLEDGNTPNLKLSLFLPSFESLPVGSWIVLNSKTQVIYGLPDEEVIQAQPEGGYRYLLVGQDSGGQIASASVVVGILRTNGPYNYQITARLRSYLDASLPPVDHVVEFLEKLSKFYGEDKEKIRIVSYNISKNYPADVTISWTNRSASFNTCNHEAITESFQKFSDGDAGVIKDFSEILLPYFIMQDIKLEFLESCSKVFPNTPPILLLPVETLNIPVYHVLRFQLPAMMFHDAEDGYTRNLTVFVLDNHNKPLNSSFWIQFDSTTQLLYGLPTSAVAKEQPAAGYVIHIIAMDTDSNRVNSTVHIAVDDAQERVSYVLKISMTVNISLEYSDIDLMLDFLVRVKTFLENPDTIVTDYLKDNTTLTVWLSTVDFLSFECSFSELQEISDNLLFKNVKNVSKVTEGRRNDTEPSFAKRPNQNFTRIMLPDFLVSSVTEHKSGPCSNTAPIILEAIPHFVISTGGLFSIALPLRTFYDAEDGFTSNLSLTLLSSSGHILPPNSWLQFNDSTDQIYGIITEDLSLSRNYTFVLIAQDSYGLNINTSFTIEVSSRLRNLGFKINLIFKSNFSSIVPHVDIITLLLEKMTSYYQNTITFNVLSFERGSGVPSTDILSWSVTELDSENCDLRQLHDISRKTRISSSQPNEEFKRALLPEFELLAIFEQRLGSCADSLNFPPTVLAPILSLNISRIPTVFHYTIPRNIFHDPEDGDTRNLTLSLLDEHGEEILRNSSVQLNQPLQMLYGIFTESDFGTNARLKKRAVRSSQVSMNFILLAVDSGGRTVRSVLEIILGNDIVSRNYEQHITFISYLSSTSPDVMHLINFQEKLRKFEALRDMQVVAYMRSPDYPVKFEVRFTNSTSNVNHSFCDFHEISRVTETFQDSSSNLKSEFTTTFLPEFVVQKSYIQRFGPCESLPNSPPSINRLISVVNVSSCEVLKYQIPEDVFVDEDGNTRNLILNLEHVLPQEHRIDWISFDDLSQTIYAVPSLKVVENQPSNGYVFRLTAKDSQGEVAELNLSIFVRNAVVRNSYTVTVDVRVPFLIKTKDDLVLKTVEFVEATKRYLSSSSTKDVHVIDFRNVSQSVLSVTWSNCSLRYKPCDRRNIEEIRLATIHTGTIPQPRFIQSLAPAFIVNSVEDEMRGPCLNQRPVVLHELESLNLTICDGLFHYTVPNNTFFDAEDGYTPNLTLSILSGSSVPLSDNYWLSIDHSQTIVAYPNLDALQAQPESGYDFLISAKDSHGLSTNLAIKVLYEVDGRHTFQSTYEVTFVLQATNTTPSVEQMQVILHKLAGYMGGSEKSIRVHSFLSSGVNSTTSFFTWSNCSFLSSVCDLLGIVETSKRLRSANGQVLNELTKAFRPEFLLKFVFEQRLGACLGDTNVRPKAKQSLYQISIEHFCGVWQFQIPEDFFFDAEDGGTRNLTLSFKTIDSMEMGRDSWIQLDQERQILFGFPILSTSSNSSASELFILLATDSQGKLAKMNLEILFNTQRPNVHYSVLVGTSSFVGEHLADVHHLKKFVERLALFLKSETGAVLIMKYERRTTAGISSRLSVTWTNCSVSVNTCDQYQIDILREKLNLARGKVDMVFAQSMLPYFVPNLITLEKYGLCRNEALKSPPRLVRPIGRILAYSGGLLMYSIPEDSFVDDEDGNALNLSFVLQFSNNLPVLPSYWLKFDNTSRQISGVSLVKNSWKRSFRLVARDQHGNEAADTFEVFLESSCPENLLGYQVFTEVVYTGNEESLNAKFLRKLESYFQTWFRDTNFTILSTKAKVNNTFLIVWTHARTCGACFEVNATVQALSENLTDINGTVLPEFKNVLLPEFIVVNISEHKCIPPPVLPITIVKGGKEERWKLYVVPIVVLLIFLLFSFIFFICRGFLFPYESKKEEVILEESPVSEIHVTERIRPSEASTYNSASTAIINEAYLANADVNTVPEIFLDKRVSPSKSSLPRDLSPVSAQDVEPAIVAEPPLYPNAVLHLTAESSRKPGGGRTSIPANRESPIEMRELHIMKREVALSSQAIPVSEKSELNARLSSESVPNSEISHVDGRRTPREDKSQAVPSPSLQSKPDDTIDYEDDPIPLRNRLLLPTAPEVGILRLPPVPKPLNSPSTPSPMANPLASPLGNTPISPTSSAYSTPLLTPSYSQTTVNNTYNVRQIRRRPEKPQYDYPNPPAYTEYPYGTPMRERTELGIQSPIGYTTPIRERMQLGVQSPLGFPFPQGRVPYVDHREPRPPVESKPSDLHDVLGQLRQTVNRELDRRNEVDKYIDLYLNQK